MAELIEFQKFEIAEDAASVASLLEQSGIYAVVEQDRLLLDQNIIGRQYDNYILLKIRAADFTRAQEVLIAATRVSLADVPQDYMLLSFTTDELMDVVAKPDEWGAYNYNVAMALLQQRGEVINEAKTMAMHAERKAEVSKPRDLSFIWFLLGYGFSALGILARFLHAPYVLLLLYGFYLLPGILGIIIGIFIRYTRRTLPDGTRMWSFSPVARRHGLYMLALGVIALIVLFYRGIVLNEPSF